MPLKSILPELVKAKNERYAIPAYDTLDMNATEGMFLAFEEKNAPGVIAIYGGLLERPYAHALSAYVRERAKDFKVPISLMLDHGASFEQCIKAISYGFTDVMYDGSKLPLEENIKNTKDVVRAAHAVGVYVEAELGHVGSGSNYLSFGALKKGFTDPDTVEIFVKETGVDFLAIAIGTAHGLYQGDPHIDLELLKEIRSRVEIPLVLHGGSGCTEEQFRSAIETGISKINIATDLFMTAGKKLIEVAKGENASYFSISSASVEAFHGRCMYYLDLFGTTGKA
jgi:fructose-bisphosphate aldolase class II